jgi:hypothetical protein
MATAYISFIADISMTTAEQLIAASFYVISNLERRKQMAWIRSYGKSWIKLGQKSEMCSGLIQIVTSGEAAITVPSATRASMR